MRKWFLIIFVVTTRLFAAQIFWEGEEAVSHTFNLQGFPPISFGERKEELIGEDWLYHNGTQPPAAKYLIDVPQTSDYHFYARVFWHHGPFRWRFDDALWQSCDYHQGLIDWVVLVPKICANWKYLGRLTLTEGRHLFEIQVDDSPTGKAIPCAFDCFLLTDEVIIPYGKYFDGLSRTDQESFAYNPPRDPFKEAHLDLRSLNEETAGQNGFITRDGEKLRLGDGNEVKLWGVNIPSEILRQPDPLLDYLAKRLAKMGVNAVRCHSSLFSGDEIDEKQLDRLHYLVATMKRQGIYTTLSFFYPLWIEPHPFALLFFDEETQSLWRNWAKALLHSKNPYTGTPLAQDPALAMVEIVNEDSLFFWTFSEENIPPSKLENFEKIYGHHLSRKYGSLEKAFVTWPFARHKRDDQPNGRAGLYNAGELTGSAFDSANSHKRRRIQEQRQFFLETQKAFYAAARRFLREDLHYGGLVIASNWITADPNVLDGLERESYREGDLIDNHAYFNPAGEGLPYAVSLGDTVKDRSALLEPDKLPLPKTTEGYPHITSELGWTNPNRFLAEGPFLMSAAPNLNGLFWFCVNRIGTLESITKFPVSTASIQGQFPAYALQFRRYNASFEIKGKVAIVDTPFSQGAAGFLKEAGPLDFGDCTLESDNEYGAVCLISLDGQPLATSEKMLVQAFTEEAPYQFTLKDKTITDLGRPPLTVKFINCRLTLKGAKPNRVVALDFNGYIKEERLAEQTITLPKESLYTIIERKTL